VKRVDLPVLTGLTALSLGHALLHLEDGSSIEVDARQPGAWLLGVQPPFALVIGLGDAATGYQVPAHLEGSVCAALNLYRPHDGPPRLTLTGIDQQPEALTFQAVNQAGQAVALSVPLPVFTELDFNPSSLPEPVGLIVTHDRAQPHRAFHFEIQPETPEGCEVLELLGYADRLKASDEKEVI